MRVRCAATLLLAVAVSALPSAARADPARAADAAGADKLFEEGKELWRAGHHAEACSKFEASLQLDASASAAAKIGKCREEEGSLAAAWAGYHRAQRLARVKTLPPEQRTRLLAWLDKALANLAPRLPTLRIRIAGPRPAGLVVTRGGAALPLSGLGERLPVDPGPLVVRAGAPHCVGFEQRIDVRAGQQVDVMVSLPIAPDRAGIAARRAKETRRSVGIGVGGLGLTAIGIGGVLGLRTLSLVSGSAGYCTAGDDCVPRGVELRTAARHTQTAAIAVAASGAALLGGGIVIVLSSRP